jgi:hypothetical protein
MAMLVPLIYRQTIHRKAKTRAGVRLGFSRKDGKRLTGGLGGLPRTCSVIEVHDDN